MSQILPSGHVQLSFVSTYSMPSSTGAQVNALPPAAWSTAATSSKTRTTRGSGNRILVKNRETRPVLLAQHLNFEIPLERKNKCSQGIIVRQSLTEAWEVVSSPTKLFCLQYEIWLCFCVRVEFLRAHLNPFSSNNLCREGNVQEP